MRRKRIKIPRTCLHCETHFIALFTEVKRGGGKYCSPRCYHESRRIPLEQRFWEKVHKTETCWLWTASTHTFGYGKIGSGERRCHSVDAHRVSWELHYGKIPSGMSVLHRCDVPACVRPDHLFLGTTADNLRDMALKGRSTRGERQHQARFTRHDIREIRQLADQGVPRSVIAEQFNTKTGYVTQIINRRKWAWLE